VDVGIYIYIYEFQTWASSVGIATGYGLDDPFIGPLWERDFPHPSSPALGPIRPPIQWVTGFSRG